MIQPSAEDFLQACGARAPLQFEIEHLERKVMTRRTLALPFALIGREEWADLRLDDKDVSQRHAYLQMVAGRCWWVDLGSRTGTQLAPPLGRGLETTPQRGREQTGQTAPPRPQPQLGQLLGRRGIRIGPYIIRLTEGGIGGEDSSATPVNPLTSSADDPSSLPRLILEFHGGTQQQRTWMVDRPLTLVGRAAFCKVRLHNPMVSRMHCALVNTPAGLWAIDLLSREGISVNGTTVRWARLEPEDELQIYPFRIRLRCLAPVAAPLGRDLQTTPQGGIPTSVMVRSPDCAATGDAVSPGQALIPSGLAVARNGNESLLLPLISQFSLMQQQMFEQFQQTLLMMAQTFGNLHQEQMALVRQELEQIQDLTRQLHSLQSEGMRQTPSPRTAVPSLGRGLETTPQRETTSQQGDAAASAEAAPPAAAPCTGEVHLWLSQRLATLQQERQTRWQKLLNIVTGK